MITRQTTLRLSGCRSGQALPAPPTCPTNRMAANVHRKGAGGSAGPFTIVRSSVRSSFGLRTSRAGGLVRPAPGR